METRLQMEQEKISVNKSEVTLEVKMGEMGEMGAQSMAVLFEMERIERRR